MRERTIDTYWNQFKELERLKYVTFFIIHQMSRHHSQFTPLHRFSVKHFDVSRTHRWLNYPFREVGMEVAGVWREGTFPIWKDKEFHSYI